MAASVLLLVVAMVTGSGVSAAPFQVSLNSIVSNENSESDREIHETCHSTTFYVMSELIFLYQHLVRNVLNSFSNISI